MPGIGVGIGIPFRRNEDWASSYWKTLFTGVPIKYAGNLLPVQHPSQLGMFRAMVLVEGVYHSFEEVNTGGTNPTWTVNKRTSTDGIVFGDRSAALMAAGGAGTYDYNGQADPSVIYDGAGDWKMYYDAMSQTGWFDLGLATSADGTTWTKQGSILQRGASGAWDDYAVHHPACVKHNGVYYLFYSASGDAPLTVKHIGVATSPDGVTFTKHGTTPVISAGGEGTFDAQYIRPSVPVLIYGIWYMWYWACDAADKHTMGLAKSTDLLTWTKMGMVYEATTETNVQASNIIYKEGTGELDKICQMWYTNGTHFYFANICLPSDKTKLSGFYPAASSREGDYVIPETVNGYAANYVYLLRMTVASAITPSSIRLWFTTLLQTSNTHKIKCAIYSNASNAPVNLLGYTEEKLYVHNSINKWIAFNFVTPPELAAGDYWIAVWANQGFSMPRGGSVVGDKSFGYISLAYAADFPATIESPTLQTFADRNVHVAIMQANTYEIALTSEPTKVYFNGVEGNKKASIAQVNEEYAWYWAENVLYVYSTVHADIGYQIRYE